MAKVEIAPASREDIKAAMRLFSGREWEIPVRVVAFAGKIDGRVIGVGGIAFRPDGHRAAFCDVGEEGRSYPIALHRAALMTIAAAKKAKVKRLIATTRSMHPKSPHWLIRLGFRVETFDGGVFYVRDL